MSWMTSPDFLTAESRRRVLSRLLVNPAAVALVAVTVGIILRLATWANNRSFWLDEVYLALNITQRSLSELWQPLDFDQGAPLGFLTIVKLTTLLFGQSEWALRLVPFAAGIMSMLVFPDIARRWLSPAGACFATILFALAPKLIYYSSELKQYSSDVLITLVFLWLATERQRVRTLTLAGALAVWFSHPVVFVMAGVGSWLWWSSDAADRRRWLVVGAIWLSSFGLCYFVSLRSLSSNQYLLNYWTEYFAPVVPRNMEQAGWYLRAMGWLFEGPMGMMVADISFAIPAVMLFSAGLWNAFRTRPALATMIVVPLVLTLLASMGHRYPFGGRLLLFAVPLICLGLGAGWEALRPGWHDGAAMMCLGLCGAVVFAPAASSLQQIIQRKVAEDHRAALKYMGQHWQTGDGVYLSSMARAPFLYYGRVNQIPDTSIVGQPKRDDWDHVHRDIQRMQGRDRLWVFVAHERGANHQFTTWQLDRQGRRLQEFTAPGVAVYLYDLRATP